MIRCEACGDDDSGPWSTDSGRMLCELCEEFQDINLTWFRCALLRHGLEETVAIAKGLRDSADDDCKRRQERREKNRPRQSKRPASSPLVSVYHNAGDEPIKQVRAWHLALLLSSLDLPELGFGELLTFEAADVFDPDTDPSPDLDS